jgi:hypothetical protein
MVVFMWNTPLEKLFFFLFLAPAVVFFYLVEDKLGFELGNNLAYDAIITSIFWICIVLLWFYISPLLSILGLAVPISGYYLEKNGR